MPSAWQSAATPSPSAIPDLEAPVEPSKPLVGPVIDAAIGNAKCIYALTGFTVEVRPRGHGAYNSIASVTLMIAKELLREITKRDAPHQLSAE